MINYTIAIFVFVCAVLLPNIASAEQKIAALNLEGVLSGSDYAIKQFDTLTKAEDYQKLLVNIDELKKTLAAMQQEASANGASWSNEKKQQYAKEGNDKALILQRLSQQQSAVLEQFQGHIQKKLGPVVKEIIVEIVREKNLALLVSEQDVYFRSVEFDISKEVLQRLNKKINLETDE